MRLGYLGALITGSDRVVAAYLLVYIQSLTTKDIRYKSNPRKVTLVAAVGSAELRLCSISQSDCSQIVLIGLVILEFCDR